MAFGFGWRNVFQLKAARTAMTRPEYGFLYLLLMSKRTKDGEPRSTIQAMRDLYALGKFQGIQASKKFGNFVKSLMPDPEMEVKISRGLRDKDWEQIGAAAGAQDDGVDRSEARRPDPEPSAFRMDPEAQGPTSGDNVRVSINPAPTENQVGSNRVGPERQLRGLREDETLTGPATRIAGRGLPRPDPAANDNDAGEDEADAGRAARQAALARLAGQPVAANDEAPVQAPGAGPAAPVPGRAIIVRDTEWEATRQAQSEFPKAANDDAQARADYDWRYRTGEAAADRGAARARQIAAGRASAPPQRSPGIEAIFGKKKRQVEEQEM